MRAHRLLAVLIVVALAATSAIATAVTVASPALASARLAGAPVAITPNGNDVPIELAGGQTQRVQVMGLTGEQLTISTLDGTFASRCALHMSLRAPDGSVLAGPACAGTKGSMSAPSLPADGVYKVVLTAAASATGSLFLRARTDAGPPSITPDADSILVKWPRNTNEDFRLGFVSAANARYSVVMTGGRSQNQCQVSARFLDSDGNPVGTTAVTCAGFGGFIDATTMPAKGTYSVQLVGYDFIGLAVTLYKVVDQTGPVATDGTPTPINLTIPGQRALLTFAGTAGEKTSFALDSGNSAHLALFRPDGSEFREADGPILETSALDMTGTWTIIARSLTHGLLQDVLRAYEFDDLTAPADLSGAAVAVHLVPGQSASFTFAGTTGQHISVFLSKSPFGFCPDNTVFLKRPDGSLESWACGRNPFIDTQTLDVSGVWQVLVQSNTNVAGTANLQVNDVVDQTGAIVLDGPPVQVDVTEPGQNASFTFHGTVGQQVSVSLTNEVIPNDCKYTNLIQLLDPNGALVAAAGTCGSTSALIGPVTLAKGGTWTVRYDPEGPGVGTATLQASTQP